MDSDLSYQLTFGTYEDALRMVGAAGEPRTARTPVSGARVQLFAAMVHDGNRSYWDAEFARQRWGGLLAPPALRRHVAGFAARLSALYPAERS